MPTIDRRHTTHGPRYRVRVRLRGLRPLTRTFPSLTLARRWGISTEHAALTAQAGPEAVRHSLGDVITRYRREILPRKSPGTQRNHAIHLTWWQTELGYLRLADMTPGRLVECREKLSQRRSAGTVNQYLLTLGHALAVAVRLFVPNPRKCKISPNALLAPPAAPGSSTLDRCSGPPAPPDPLLTPLG